MPNFEILLKLIHGFKKVLFQRKQREVSTNRIFLLFLTTDEIVFRLVLCKGIRYAWKKKERKILQHYISLWMYISSSMLVVLNFKN